MPGKGKLGKTDFHPTCLVNFFLHNVPCQLAALRALVVAKPTFIRLLPRVTPSVHCQVGTVLENLEREIQRFNFVF